MRRFALSLLIVWSLIAVLPVLAQDDESDDALTIAEIVAGDENYSLLLEAVLAADPLVLEALSDPDGEFTVFAPTDSGFRNIASFFNTDLDTLLSDPDVVTELLLYHVVPGVLTAEQVAAFDGLALDTLTERARVRINVQGGVIRLNDIVRVIAPFDVQASNGVIHTIADVIFPFTIQPQLEALSGVTAGTPAPSPEATPEPVPLIVPSANDGLTVTGTEEYPDEPQTEIRTVATFPTQLTVAGRLVTDSRYDTLEAIMRAVAPDYLDLLNDPDLELTLLAPTNSAFVGLLSTLGLTLEDALEFPVLLRQIVAYHVIEGAVTAPTVRTLSGQRVDTILDNGDFREGVLITINAANQIILNNIARVTTPDRSASNGVIHTIDNVLLPQVAIDTLEELGVVQPGTLSAD